MDLTHHADALPPELTECAPVTLLGAAHTWAARAKTAEAELVPLRRRLRVYELTVWALIPAAMVPWVFLWMRG